MSHVSFLEETEKKATQVFTRTNDTLSYLPKHHRDLHKFVLWPHLKYNIAIFQKQYYRKG